MAPAIFWMKIDQDTSFQAQMSRKRAWNMYCFARNSTESALHFENLENRLVLLNINFRKTASPQTLTFPLL